jgi:D-alanine-D-alanine ligase
MKKLRVGILFGGRSGEHEVSLLSAASVFKAIDSNKYEVVPIGITKDGRWLTASDAEKLLHGTADEGNAGGGARATLRAGIQTARLLLRFCRMARQWWFLRSHTSPQ